MKIIPRYCLIILLYVLIILFLEKILKIQEMSYSNLAERLTRTQLKEMFDLQDKTKLINYVIFPLFILLKTLIIASIIYIGSFFYSKNEIAFKNIWSIVISAEFIFLLVPIFKIIWFYFFQTNYTLEDLQYFYPISAINITGYKGLEPWLIYPLQTLNLFELAYIIYLAYQIGTLTKTNADTGLKIVAFSYVPALLLWVTVVMFFTLNYS